MHIDLAHALVAAVLIFATIWGMERAGLYVRHKEGGPRFSWPLFFAILVVMTTLNLIWP
ncbi:hypothetical protein SAMN05421759_10516 [Roseivivax lentus]|uniref:Uncharacterized protein n=1 Tax=Roseivivax lentus TaxID=633194 RepID=A0A1N7MN38_9RHOB|nr:hypothetical protein [Roseivivax lentus]SIS87442.1 hypothetical protein SAMN05421759_10516 [Roseivivax lentus]